MDKTAKFWDKTAEKYGKAPIRNEELYNKKMDITRGYFQPDFQVFEFGCGTGRFAEQLLANHLPSHATYWGCDISTTMTDLSKLRLAHFGDQATLWKSTGETSLPLPDTRHSGRSMPWTVQLNPM